MIQPAEGQDCLKLGKLQTYSVEKVTVYTSLSRTNHPTHVFNPNLGKLDPQQGVRTCYFVFSVAVGKRIVLRADNSGKFILKFFSCHAPIGAWPWPI